MRHLKRVKYALVVMQVFVIAGAFLFFWGWVAMGLFIAGELSVSEILDYILLTTTFEGVGLVTFLEGLLWVFFKHRVK